MRFLKNFKKVRRNVFTGSLVEEDLYNKFFEALESKSKIEEALKDIYQILENKNIEEMDKFESLTKSYFLTLSGGRPRSLPNIFTSITRNLIRMIKSKHIRNEFKESKKIFYIVLMSFSKYLPWDMISRYELVSLFAYLVTENNINFILDDLKLRMTHSGTNAHTSYTETEEIENRFTFEGYLYFLKMKIYSLLHKKLTQDSLDDIRKRFKQLSRLSKNSLNNKYLIGQSRKLLDLVDLLFNMNPPSNLPDTDLYGMILENKNKIIDQCVDPLLECLCESLKYHCNPSYFKKYIQIIPRLAYQIKNYDPEENNFEGFDIPQPLGGYFLEKYLKILEKILVPPKIQLQLIDPSYFTINNLQISNYELLRNNKPYSFFSKLSDKDTHIIIKLCYKLDPIYTSFQVPIVVKLKEIDLFVILVDPGIKDNTQKSWFSFYKCDKKGSFTGNNERRILAIYYKKTEQNLVTSFDEDQELLLENDKYVCLKIDWYRKDKIRVSICNKEETTAGKELSSNDKLTTRDKEVMKFVQNFRSIPERHEVYLFPYFSGNVVICQVYLNALQKKKKKNFFKFWKKAKKNTPEDLKDDCSEDFCIELTEESMKNRETYLSFLQSHTDEAFNSDHECLLSIHSQNSKKLTRFIPRENILEKEEIRPKPARELFLELAVSDNNNLLLPLIDIVANSCPPNCAEIIGNIMNAIMAFNQLVQMYPQYKKFMVKNGYDLVLRKTFEMNIQYFEPNHYSGLFLNAPEIFFLVKLESSVYAKFEQIDESFAKSVFSQGPFKFRKVSSPRRNLLASQPLEEGKDEKTNRKNQQLCWIQKLMESNFSKIDKKTIPRICFLFSLYIGDHTEDDQDMYFFLGDHIRTCFQKFSKKLSNQSDKTVFLSYLESLLDDPKSYISNFNSGDMAQRLQVLQKIIYVLDPSWAKDFYQEYIRICFKVLLKIYRVNSEPKKRHVKHRSKVPEEDRLISVEEESKENLMETTKFKPLDTENNKYCELDFRIQNNESGEEKEIKGKLIAAIVIRLANIKRSVRTEDLNNNIYSFDFVKLLKALIIKFNDKCRIALTSGEVAEIFSTIDLKFHQEILEILFPVLILETQLELVSQFEFDPIEENKIQVFDCIKTIERSHITSFMHQIQCPMLMLNYIKYKLQEEIDTKCKDPPDSFILELLYLFNDFLVMEYDSIVSRGDFGRLCKCGWNKAYPRMRKYTDYSNTSDFSIPNTPYEPRTKNCHECFGRDKWHDLALEITKLFIQVLEDFKTTYPCIYQEDEPVENYHDLHENEDVIKYKLTPIRNGGTLRILLQNILILIRGSVKIRLKNSNTKDAVLKQSREDSQKFKFEIKKTRKRKYTERHVKGSMCELEDDEYDISNLIDLLYDISFIDKDIHTSIDRSLSTDGQKPINSSEMFKFAKTSNNKYEIEMKEQKNFFQEGSQELIQTQSCNDNCLIHNGFNLRGVILNELLMTLSYLVENEQEVSNSTGLMLIPNDTILKILKYLKVLCSDPEEYEKSEELYFITFFRDEVSSIFEQKERMFKTNELITDSEVLSNFQDDQTEREGDESNKNIISPLPLDLDQSPNEEEKGDSSLDSDSEATNYCEAITSLSNFDIHCKDLHSELFKILKKVNHRIYREVLKKINPDYVINRLVRKITKERRNHLKKTLYEPSYAKIHYPKASELEAPHLHQEIKIAIKKYRRQQWEEEFKGTFIYREDKNQSFTKQYEKFSKDKSSLWFDNDQYRKIKDDYNYIRREWQNRESKSKRKDNDQGNTIEIQSKDIQLSGLEEAKTQKAVTKGVNKKTISQTSLKSYEIDPSCISNPAGIRKSRISTFGDQRESLFAIDQLSIDQQNCEGNELTETDRGTNYEFMQGAACLSSEINAPSPPISEIDKRDGDSNPSKTLGSLSESTKTPGNGPNGRHEFRVVENLLSNVFTKLSPFSDGLGRRLIFEVDWDYLERKWEITHSTLKDEFMEKILAMSLQPQIIESTEEGSSIKSLQNDIEKELSEILNKSILLPHLLNKEYDEDENSENLISNFYSNSKTKLNFSDKFDKNWGKRKSILKFIRPEDAFECEWITPGGSFYGRIYIIHLQTGSKMFYFRSKETPDEEKQGYTQIEHVFRSIDQQRRVFKKEFLFEVTEVMAKNYLCISNSVEIYDSNSNQYYFFNFFDNERQIRILKEMGSHCTSVIHDCAKEFHKRKYTEKWKNKKLSSFDYLLLINKFSSRSFNDLSQYPMMPWIGPCGSQNLIQNPTEEDIERGYVRDLKKNTGILHQKKYEKCLEYYDFVERNNEMQGDDFQSDPTYGDEPYYQKFGFMNPQVCLAYLVRIEPFCSLFVQYNSKLDDCERMFYDCSKMWRKIYETSHQCNSELVPEWFYLPQLFQNKNYCNFGRLHHTNNQTCHDVFLPKWANNNPFIFCMKYREFIEDPTYSSNLPEWIDMTFGKKQQKKECTNIFFQFATSEYYEKATIKNLEENTALSSATDFYQLPKCIFAKEHRIIQQKEPNEALMEEPHTEANQETSKNDELKIRANGKIFTKKVEKFDKNRKDQIVPNFEVIAGNVREETSSCYLAWKMEKEVSLLIIQKTKINAAAGEIGGKLFFEVDFPSKTVFSSNYISQFSIGKRDFCVICRLHTCKFVVVNTSSEPMSCEYFGLDWMKNKITAIHCSSDNKRIICGYETGTMAIWEIEKLEGYNPNEEAKDRTLARRNSNANIIKQQKDPRKFYKLNLKSCQSSSYSSGYEIVAIDANPDLEMFVTINKHFVATIHSLKTGACLNWIKFSIDSRSIQGIQLSKNGYFVLTSCVRTPKQNPATQKLENNCCTSFQTFGINGECITPEPFYTNSVIQAAIMSERLYSTIGSIQSSESNPMTNKIDDKIFLFDRSRAFCMNCIDFELTEFDYDLNKKKYKFLAHCFNSKKGWVMISKTTIKDFEDYEILEPLSDKWDQLKRKLIM